MRLQRAIIIGFAIAALTPQQASTQWRYRVSEDEMTGRETRSASIRSANTVSFDFPYQGAQHATLTLRIHPQFGEDVILSIERGQMPCFQRCNVTVRFGDADPRPWGANPASSGSTEILFLQSYRLFIDRLTEVDVVRIQPEVYQEGRPVFRFNVAGFDRGRYEGDSDP